MCSPEPALATPAGHGARVADVVAAVMEKKSRWSGRRYRFADRLIVGASLIGVVVTLACGSPGGEEGHAVVDTPAAANPTALTTDADPSHVKS